jgi:hypothetical protein
LTPEMVVIGVIRIAGSLPVLRWPLAGGLLAVLVDLSDLLLMNVLDLGGLGDYQRFDKILDLVYLGTFTVVVLRWTGVERNVALILLGIRLVGLAAFELTGERTLLLLFPNLFEFWFLLVAALHLRREPVTWTAPMLAAALAVLLALKLVQEWALHQARLFDSITALEAIDLFWRWLTGG